MGAVYHERSPTRLTLVCCGGIFKKLNSPGIYQSLEDGGYVLDKEGNTVFYKSVLAGGVGGVAGQLACSPVFLVKTHLQTQSSEAIAVGHQHQHRNMWQAMALIYREQGVSVLCNP